MDRNIVVRDYPKEMDKFHIAEDRKSTHSLHLALLERIFSVYLVICASLQSSSSLAEFCPWKKVFSSEFLVFLSSTCWHAVSVNIPRFSRDIKIIDINRNSCFMRHEMRDPQGLVMQKIGQHFYIGYFICFI